VAGNTRHKKNLALAVRWPGRGSSYLPPPPQTPACRIPAQGSSVPPLLTKVETHLATPRWAHSWATLSPVTSFTLTRAVWLEVHGLKVPFPSFLPATRYTQPRLPSGGSLGPHFPTFYVTFDDTVLCSATTATCPSRWPSLVARPPIPCLSPTFVSFLQAR